jgi:hypothetical protein
MEDILRSAGIDPGESVFDPEPIDDEDEVESDIDDYNSSNHLSSDYSSTTPDERKSFESVTTPQSASSVSVESPSQAIVLKTDRGRRDGLFFGRERYWNITRSTQGADVVKDLRRVTTSYPRKEFDLFERNQASKTFPKTY